MKLNRVESSKTYNTQAGKGSTFTVLLQLNAHSSDEKAFMDFSDEYPGRRAAIEFSDIYFNN